MPVAAQSDERESRLRPFPGARGRVAEPGEFLEVTPDALRELIAKG